MSADESLSIGKQSKPEPIEGTVTIERVNRPNGGFLTRVTQADRIVRIGLELLDSVKAGDVPCMTVEDDWLYISDDYAQQFCYRLGNLDGARRARWMEKL